MRTRASSTSNSPSTRETPGIGEVVEPNTYSIFSAVAKPRAPAIKYTGIKKRKKRKKEIDQKLNILEEKREGNIIEEINVQS